MWKKLERKLIATKKEIFSGNGSATIKGPITSKVIAEDIHKEFQETLKRIMNTSYIDAELEKLGLLTEKYQEDNKELKDKIDKLKLVGLVNTPSVLKREAAMEKELKEIGVKEREVANKKAELEKLREKIAEYNIKYPGYKFIDDDTMVGIMKKYNLYVGDSHFYGKEIPSENLDVIAKFSDKIKKSQVELEVYADKNGKLYTIPKLGIYHNNDLSSCKRAINREVESLTYNYMSHNRTLRDMKRNGQLEEYRADSEKFKYKIDYYKNILETYFKDISEYNFANDVTTKIAEYTKSDLVIIAPADHFINEKIKTTIEDGYDIRDVEGDLLTMDGETRTYKISKSLSNCKVKVIQVLDPIACLKVDGGYIIMTAWDKEADIPEIQNMGMN